MQMNDLGFKTHYDLNPKNENENENPKQFKNLLPSTCSDCWWKLEDIKINIFKSNQRWKENWGNSLDRFAIMDKAQFLHLKRLNGSDSKFASDNKCHCIHYNRKYYCQLILIRNISWVPLLMGWDQDHLV